MNSAGYGGSAPQGYEAPACVQNAMGTKDKKPFTYTPGGLDLSQIKSERMAKRLARNAQAEGAAGLSQQNRPQQQQPQSPGSCSAAQQIGAAGMGMPFQVLPPPPPPGKQLNGRTGAPPPPPPPSSSSTLAPPQKGNGTGSAPGSPNMQRKSLTPQRFEPPPMGFRPEIKIPPNPMAALRKVPPPVEKNTFWKDEYVRDRSKSPMVGENDRASSPNKSVSESVNNNTAAQGEPASVTLNNNYNNNVDKNDVNDEVDGYKKPSRYIQQNELNNRSNTSTPQSQQSTQSSQQQQQPQSNNNAQQPNLPVATPPLQQQQQQQQQSPSSVTPSQSPVTNVLTRQTDSPRSDTSTPSQRGAESPFKYAGQQQMAHQQQQRPASAISPLAQMQPTQAQSPKPATSPPAPTAASPQSSSTSNSPNSQPTAQAVPWRTQRTPATPQQQQQQPQSTTLYNNVSAQSTANQQAPSYQGPKPTNVGSLYIAPIAQPTEPQAPSVVRQFQQQQQQQQPRESPIRQLPQQQQQQQSQPPQQQQSQPLRTNVPWLSGKPKVNDQPEWARPEENGNVVPSSLNRIKSPPPVAAQQSQQQQQQQQAPTPQKYQQQQPQPYYPPQQQQQAYQTPQQQAYQPQQQQAYQPTQQTYQQPQPYYQPQQQQQPPQPQFYNYQPEQGNGFAAATPANFGSHVGGHGNSGLRLQINLNTNANNVASQQTGPRERIIPIQLEQTPTSAPSQAPNFNVSYGGMTTAPSSYVLRSPNQFVDQGYNNYPSSAGIQQPNAAVNAQRVMSPTQQLNAPRIVQQQQQYGSNNVGVAGNRSRIVPISMEGGSDGTRGPISSSPIVLQNDPRSSPIQSKSFRILQKITDTIDNGNGNNDTQVESYAEPEPQLQRPQYARQMSAQQARQQPNVEQMRRMHITPDAQQMSQTPQAWNQDMPQSYIHPSEQQVPEPKKYTGSAIPSRSFKILQAMTTPENAGPGQSDL